MDKWEKIKQELMTWLKGDQAAKPMLDATEQAQADTEENVLLFILYRMQQLELEESKQKMASAPTIRETKIYCNDDGILGDSLANRFPPIPIENIVNIQFQGRQSDGMKEYFVWHRV